MDTMTWVQFLDNIVFILNRVNNMGMLWIQLLSFHLRVI